MDNCQLWFVLIIVICLLILFTISNYQKNNIIEHLFKLDNPLYYSRPYTANDTTAKVLYDQSCIMPRYKTSHANYWYMPMQEYFDEGMNLYTRPYPTWHSINHGPGRGNPNLIHQNSYREPNASDSLSNYVTRGPISEYCFKKRMEETGDLRYSLAACDMSAPQKMMTGTIIDNNKGFIPNNTNKNISDTQKPWRAIDTRKVGDEAFWQNIDSSSVAYDQAFWEKTSDAFLKELGIDNVRPM